MIRILTEVNDNLDKNLFSDQEDMKNTIQVNLDNDDLNASNSLAENNNILIVEDKGKKYRIKIPKIDKDTKARIINNDFHFRICFICDQYFLKETTFSSGECNHYFC